MNGVLTSALGSAAVMVAGTIWSSKTTIAVTRKAWSTARCGSALPVPGAFGTTIRCSVPPGRRCVQAGELLVDHDLASGSAGSKRWPESTLTRSAVTPSEPSGPATVVTWVAVSRPCGPGSTVL